MSETLTSQILAAEQARCEAMLRGGGAALAAVLDPRLQFHHATGAADDRDAYLAKMAAGRIRYIAVAWAEEKVTALGEGVAMLTGRMITDVAVEGTEKRLDNRVITVWVKGDGQWRMAAFQSTPLAG